MVESLILLVDDNPAGCTYMQELLERHGSTVTACESAAKATELAVECRPDAIVLKAVLGNADGIELCAQWRSNPVLECTPVVLIFDAGAAPEARLAGLHAGAAACIASPLRDSEFVAQVQTLARLCAAGRKTRDTRDDRTVLSGTSRETIERGQAEETLHKAKADAETANARKSEFLADMSHEIRTPLTAILGFTDILCEEIACCPKCALSARCAQRTTGKEAAETVRRNAKYLLDIIDDVLDLSKIEAGKVEVESIDCSLLELVAGVRALMQVRADARCLALDVQYLGAVPETIHSDPTRLREILINLLGNAVKFTQTGGVRLSARFVNGAAAVARPAMQFEVTDTGIGMTEEQAAKLFRPFAQADASTARRFGGTGLGLSISKRLAELLGGELVLVHTKPGCGTRFRVTIPTGPIEGIRFIESPSEVGSVKAPATSDKGRELPELLPACHVLLAEDDPDSQRLISHILTKAGAEVTVAENGQVAVERVLTSMAQGDLFDIILMDMQMPVMDGYEATASLRRKGYAGPIIALTAHAMEGDRQKCIAAGCNAYAAKPLDRAGLISTIRTRLAQRTSDDIAAHARGGLSVGSSGPDLHC